MAFGQILNFLLMIVVGVAFAEFEVINGPEENSNLSHLVCNEFWVAWSNNSDPFYEQLSRVNTFNRTNETLGMVSMSQEGAPVILFVSDEIVVFRVHAIRVLSGSHPIINVKYFEEGENGTMGRPVICETPPDEPVEPDRLLLSAIYITTSLAIIASLIALITYILLKKLRTLPGLVIMNLFVAFIAGDVMTQIRVSLAYRGVETYIEVVAVNQGFLIARYVWMSLTGFEMCRSLYQGVRLIGTNRPYHKLIMISIYMAIGWGIPTVLTGIMYGVEKSDSETAKKILGAVGYLTYHTTIGLTLLFNIAVVVFISIIFYNAAKRQRRLKSSYNNQNINFIRLFLIILTVLGLVWILFFVLQNDVIRATRAIVIIYVILTATQPIFVFIAFICTAKVYRMYLVLFGIRKERDFHSKTSQRQGTITSLYSERDLQRGRTIISIVSDKEFPSPDKTTAALPTIQEGDEEEDVTTVENGKTVMEAVNSVPLSNGFHSPTKTGCPDKIHEELILGENEHVSEEQPNTSTLSNDTNITNGLPIINGGVRGVSPSGSNNSLNADREETNV